MQWEWKESKSRTFTSQPQICILSNTSSQWGQLLPVLAPEIQGNLTVWYCFWEAWGRWEPRSLPVPEFVLLQCAKRLLAHLRYSRKYQAPLGSRAVQGWSARICSSIFPAPDALPYISIKVAKAKEYSTKLSLWLKDLYKSKGHNKDKCSTKNNRKIMRS